MGSAIVDSVQELRGNLDYPWVEMELWKDALIRARHVSHNLLEIRFLDQRLDDALGRAYDRLSLRVATGRSRGLMRRGVLGLSEGLSIYSNVTTSTV
jgi:hypothetical protein